MSTQKGVKMRDETDLTQISVATTASHLPSRLLFKLLNRLLAMRVVLQRQTGHLALTERATAPLAER